MFTLQISGINQVNELKVAVGRMTPEFRDNFLDEGGKFGTKVMKFHVPKGVRPNGLKNDIIHHRVDKNTEVIRFNRMENQMIGAYNEFGVSPFYRNVYNDPELLRWAKVKIPSFIARGGRNLLIGGPRSHIRTGKSKNTFVDESVRDLTNHVEEIANSAWKRVKNK